MNSLFMDIGFPEFTVVDEELPFNFTSSRVTDFTCWRWPRTVRPLNVMSCLVGLLTRMLTRQVEPPATVSCVSGFQDQWGRMGLHQTQTTLVSFQLDLL